MKKYLALLLILSFSIASFATGSQVTELLSVRSKVSGNMLSGGKVYTYTAGTSTPKAVYTNVGLTATAANPVILDSYGMAEVFASGNYRFIIKDSANATQYDWDNLSFSNYSEDFTGDVSITGQLTVDGGPIILDQKLQAQDSGGLEFASDEGTTRMTLADSGTVDVVGAFTAGTIASDGNLSGVNTTITGTLGVTGVSTLTGQLIANGSVSLNSSVTIATLNVTTRPNDKTGFIMPVGTIVAYGGSATPSGWIICNGGSYSTTTYADLYAVVGTANGSVGAGFFNVPDLRGRFARGWDNGAGNDPDAAARVTANIGGASGDNIGSYQADEYGSHTHGTNAHSWDGAGPNPPINAANGTTEITSDATGGNETRPVNVYVNYIIKY